MYDVIIIGAGVVGSLIARALSRYRLKILLLDKAWDVGEGTTKANTAIVHAGYDAKPGTLKAKLNVAGNALYDQVCGELDVDFERCGTYVVALSSEELPLLEELRARGRENGVPGLSILSAEEMFRREPALNPATKGALHAPGGGLVDPFGLCIGAAENAVLNGVELRLGTLVSGILRQGDEIGGVITPGGAIRARWTIIAAGLWADELMASAGLSGFHITPRKGEYFVLDKVAAEQVRSVLFPCPTPISKGILVTRTIHGNVLLGPNAADVDDKEDLRTTAAGLDEVLAGALKLVPSLDTRQVIRTFAGLRAAGSGGPVAGDFYIDIPAGTRGLLVLAGIESPGLTASPAIAEYVVDLLREAGLKLEERPDYNPQRRAIPRFSELSTAEREALIALDPRYGRVICRCETVTEGEIVAACHGPIPARTYDALKRRTRVGTGRCQGAFDLPRVLQIMSRELGVSPLELTKQGPGSPFLLRRTKEVQDGAV
ncbi:MAG: NAD(P)/FAD-dependent oxidoreductase [Chloroflexi bacterium]|nr:NAD(P)/FAD-dependent oxidoreductase [Chloroflexota bacterium]